MKTALIPTRTTLSGRQLISRNSVFPADKKDFKKHGMAGLILLVLVWVIYQHNVERKDWYDYLERRDDKVIETIKSLEEVIKVSLKERT